MSSTAHIFLKKGMLVYAGHSSVSLSVMERGVELIMNPWLFGGMFLHVAALGVWLIVLSRVDITFAYPFLALGYVLVSLMAWGWLGEQITMTKLIGMIVIMFGIFILSHSG